MATPFNLTVQSFHPPRNNRPIRFTFSTSNGETTNSSSSSNSDSESSSSSVSASSKTTATKKRRNPLFPATSLQPSWLLSCGQEIFDDAVISAKDITVESEDGGPGGSPLYAVTVKGAPRARPHMHDMTADLQIYAWKGEKVIGKWTVGQVQRLSA